MFFLKYEDFLFNETAKIYQSDAEATTGSLLGWAPGLKSMYLLPSRTAMKYVRNAPLILYLNRLQA